MEFIVPAGRGRNDAQLEVAAQGVGDDGEDGPPDFRGILVEGEFVEH